MRKIIALTATAVLLVALTACATSAPSGACEPRHSTGDSSSLVSADGPFLNDPAATFPTPLIAQGIQVSAVDAGKGSRVFPGQNALVQLSLYDAKTGEFLGGTGYDEANPIVLKAGDGASKIGQLVECQAVGTRVAAVIAGNALIGFQGITKDNVDVENTFVAVIDIQGSILGKAYGLPQVPQQGLPSVVTDPDGVPGITVPGDKAPTTLKIAVLQQGDGETVNEGQTIYVHYLRVNWDDVNIVKSTWTSEDGVPQPVLVANLDAATGAGLTPGMLQAIIGQKVGTQVLVVVPPAFGFPDGSAPEGVAAGDTLAYVIDILGIKSS